MAVPYLLSASRYKASVGAIITLRGRNIDDVTGVRFGPIPARIRGQGKSWVDVEVPSGAADGPVSLRTPGGEATSFFNILVDTPSGSSDDDGDAGSSGSGGGRNPLNNPLGTAATNALPQSWRNPARHAASAFNSFKDALPSGMRSKITGAAQSAGGFVPDSLKNAVTGFGAQYGLSATASLGLAGTAVAGAAASMTMHNIGATGDSGQQIVANVIGGIASGLGGVAAAGAAIAKTLAAAALQPFGATGQGIAGAVGAVGKGAMGLAGAGVSLVTDGLQTAGKMVGMAGAAGLGTVGAVVGTLIAPGIGTAIGAVLGSGLAMLAAKVVETFTGMFGKIFATIGKFAGEVGKIMGEVLGAALKVAQDVIQSMLKFSQSVMNLSQRSGLSIGQAAGAKINLMGFGLGDQAEGMYGQNVMFAGAINAAYGVRGAPGSAENILSLRAAYQNRLAMMGGNPLLANQMLGAMGQEGMMGVANMSEEQVKRQLARSSQMQSAFGMKPGEIASAQQDFGMLINSFMQFVELFKTKIGAEMLPMLTMMLDKVVAYVGENKDKIVAGIKSAVQWIVQELPAMVAHMAAAVIRHAGTLAGGLADMLDIISNFVGGLRNFQSSSFLDIFSTVLYAMDIYFEAVKRMGSLWLIVGKVMLDVGKTVAGVLTLIPQGLAALVLAILNSPLGKLLEKIPGWRATADARKWVAKTMVNHTGTALLKDVFNRGNAAQYQAAFKTLTGQGTIHGSGAYQGFANFRAGLTPQTGNLFGDASKNLRGFQAKSGAMAAKADDWGTDWSNKRGQDFDTLLDLTKRIADASEKGKDVNVNLRVEQQKDAIARIFAEFAEDSYLDATR